MTRLSEKLRFSLFYEPARFLSLKLADFSLSTLHFCKSFARALAVKAQALFAMVDSFAADDLDLWNDIDSSNYRSQRPRLLEYDDDEGFDFSGDSEKVYLVPYRWWKEVQTPADFAEGVLYDVLSNIDDDSEIVLNLKKIEEQGKSDSGQVEFSGLEYALIPEASWVLALIRHKNLRSARKEFGTLVFEEEFSQDVFALQIRLSVSLETNSLVAKINQKDNAIDSYKKACDIFILESELVRKLTFNRMQSLRHDVHIWDISGQTTKIFMNGSVGFPNGSPGKASREHLLQLQVYGFSYSNNDQGAEDDEVIEAHSNLGGTHDGFKMNGSTEKVNFYSTQTISLQHGRNYKGVGSLGLTGLQNLGNTCFMNSAIQCLLHTPELVDYFLGDYCKEINKENPLGMKGDLALEFGNLLRKLWAPGARPVAPRMFKQKFTSFSPQFSGYNQHDGQEFLSFLLDGLHEDLNCVKSKPWIEAKDAEGRPDEEVAEEHWRNHVARNDSIIVDLFQGQYRSKLVCSACDKLSVKFDPFMYLSLPLPSTTMRTMTLTVLSSGGASLPSTFTLMVNQSGRLKDLIEALSIACSLKDDETLLVAEIYKNQIFRLLDDLSDNLGLIRDQDQLVAYRLPKESETSPLLVFMHQQLEKRNSFGMELFDRKLFGIPLVSRLSDICNGTEIRNEYLKLLNPFLTSNEDILNDHNEADNCVNEDTEIEDATSPTVWNSKWSGTEPGDVTDLGVDFEFYKKGAFIDSLIKMDEEIIPLGSFKMFEVTVFWSDKISKKYDISLLDSLPVVFQHQIFTGMPQESVSLCKCLEAYLKEEPLGPENMWYCPNCKKHEQASKKLDLWTLPEILVIHLKRFSYDGMFNNKLETFVDFPIEDLDLSSYIARKNGEQSTRYILYAISNHYGGTGWGHYTTFVHFGNDAWFEFDDERVFPISEEKIKSPAAYVLFYRRAPNA